MKHKQSVTVRGEEEAVDSYYSRIFLEKNIGEFSESALRIEARSTMKAYTDASVDCVVLEMLLNRVYEYEQLLEEAKRILTRGGMLLCTLSSIAPKLHQEEHLWGFTVASAQYIFEKHFGSTNVQIASFGNVFSGRMLLEGFPAVQLRQEELEYVDPFFPVVIGVSVKKE
ncbi:MAG: methyltransferase domain-containing protein [Candidatus Moraniibacteriota bacterium]|nr:MAG: methyltransferase domain-containing protein [Candidatus Moranbacteria bacterium]